MKKLRRGDVIIISTVLVMITVSFLVNWLLAEQAPQADQVVIEVDGEVTATYSLQQDEAYRFRVDTCCGYNVLVIHDGRVQVEEADCPDQICVHMGWIQRRGQMIVCLPHQLLVRVIAGADSDALDLDGVTF